MRKPLGSRDPLVHVLQLLADSQIVTGDACERSGDHGSGLGNHGPTKCVKSFYYRDSFDGLSADAVTYCEHISISNVYAFEVRMEFKGRIADP
jgi:hypothetical protein